MRNKGTFTKNLPIPILVDKVLEILGCYCSNQGDNNSEWQQSMLSQVYGNSYWVYYHFLQLVSFHVVYH